MYIYSRILFSICIILAAAINAETGFEPKNEFPARISRMIAKHNACISDDCKIQIQCALCAFNALKTGQIAYVSTPITSGKRLYDYMYSCGYKTRLNAEADRDAFFQHVIIPNIENSNRMVAAVSLQFDGAVIAPSAFESGFHCEKKLPWGQDEFMSMWLSLIEQKVTRMIMLDGWPYSNGSCEEYLLSAAMQMGFAFRSDIQITDQSGGPLNIDQGIVLLYEAFKDLHNHGFEPVVIAETLSALFEAEQCYFEQCLANPARACLPPYDRTGIKMIADDFLSIFSPED